MPPPHQLKERVVKRYAARFGVKILVETGTYLGDMVNAMRDLFSRITSVEVDAALAAEAGKRFAGQRHISIVCGDSGVVLPELLAGMEGDCLFWLDGHYSGGITAKGAHETPIEAELRHIGAHGGSPVILIDDARLFDGKNKYPSLEDIRALARRFWPAHECEVKNDIIRIHPRLNERRRIWRDL